MAAVKREATGLERDLSTVAEVHITQFEGCYLPFVRRVVRIATYEKLETASLLL